MVGVASASARSSAAVCIRSPARTQAPRASSGQRSLPRSDRRSVSIASPAARGSVVVVVLLLEAEPFRTARTEAVPLLPPLLPNASTSPYRKPTYHAPDGSEMLDVDDQ